MSLMKWKWLSGLIFISLQVNAQQSSIHEFSAKDCIEYALKNNVQVKNALLDIQVQQQDNRAVTALALPAVNGSAGYTDYLSIPT